ncbi:4Fe-4S dicluster domain-containing protein [bacterium]|nr:4Fe-4S dicluster domain-containing protein [bacterium]
MMRAPKLRELAEAIKSLLARPATVGFPKEPCHVYEGFRGKPEFSEISCVGCGACAEVCPANAIIVEDDKITESKNSNFVRRLTVRYDACNFCGNCEAHCITEDGIKLTMEYDLAVPDRQLAREFIEHRLICCELCGTVLTTIKHLLWIYYKLGPLAWGNPNLMVTAQREMLPVEPGLPGEMLRRPDIFKVLCPKCRRNVMLNDMNG